MEELIEQHMGLVLSVVNRFSPKNQSQKDDFIQAGRIGLWKAIQKYSPTGGSKFSPYAWNPIKWEIIKEIRSAQVKYEYVNVEEVPHLCHAESEAGFWELLPSSLSETEAEIVQMRLEGYNFQEISNKLKCHRSRIKKLFNSALAKIKDTNEE